MKGGIHTHTHTVGDGSYTEQDTQNGKNTHNTVNEMGRRRLIVGRGQRTFSNNGKLVKAKRRLSLTLTDVVKRRARQAGRGKENAERGRNGKDEGIEDMQAVCKVRRAREGHERNDGEGGVAPGKPPQDTCDVVEEICVWDQYAGVDGPLVRRGSFADGGVEVLTSEGFVGESSNLAGRALGIIHQDFEGGHVELRRLPLYGIVSRDAPLGSAPTPCQYHDNVTNWALARKIGVHISLSSIDPPFEDAPAPCTDPAKIFGLFADRDLPPGHLIPFSPGRISSLGEGAFDPLSVVLCDGSVFQEDPARSLASFARDPRKTGCIEPNAVVGTQGPQTLPFIVLTRGVRRGMEILLDKGVPYWVLLHEHHRGVCAMEMATSTRVGETVARSRYHARQRDMFCKMYNTEKARVRLLRIAAGDKDVNFDTKWTPPADCWPARARVFPTSDPPICKTLQTMASCLDKYANDARERHGQVVFGGSTK